MNSCLINFFDSEKAAKEFGLNDDEEVLMMLDLGFGDNTKPLPTHSSRKKITETVKNL